MCHPCHPLSVTPDVEGHAVWPGVAYRNLSPVLATYGPPGTMASIALAAMAAFALAGAGVLGLLVALVLRLRR